MKAEEREYNFTLFMMWIACHKEVVCWVMTAFDVHATVHRDKFLIIKPTRCTKFSNLFFGRKLYMFRTISLSVVRSFSLYTQQWYTSYRFADCLQAVSKPVWHIPLLWLQWKTRDDGQRNCPKHVEFSSKNKFEKLVHLVGFSVRNSSCVGYVVVWVSVGRKLS